MWDFAGTLGTKQGRRFGFQLALFRVGLAPDAPQRASAWATNQIYRGQFALTDVARGRFHSFERFSRAALELSGATTSPARVWLENWVAEIPPESGPPDFRLRLSEGDLRLDVSLRSAKPAVLASGDDPLGDEGGAPFHFYWMTRLLVRGTLQIGAETFDVEGLAWLDRAWGSLPSPQGQVAWNRFALQLDDGREILCIQLRRRDGSAEPRTVAVLVERDGTARRFGRHDVLLEALGEWASPDDGTRYPARWRLRIPAEAIELDIDPYVADQEADHALRHWRGAVRITGNAGGKPLGGNGHVELTGYAPRGGAI
jgi:predicted secreted hydrolase